MKDFIPDNLDKDTKIIDFIDIIIDNIDKSNTPERFGEILLVISNKTIDEIKDFSGSDTIKLFAEKWQENDVYNLIKFCETLEI